MRTGSNYVLVHENGLYFAGKAVGASRYAVHRKRNQSILFTWIGDEARRSYSMKMDFVFAPNDHEIPPREYALMTGDII